MRQPFFIFSYYLSYCMIVLLNQFHPFLKRMLMLKKISKLLPVQVFLFLCFFAMASTTLKAQLRVVGRYLYDQCDEKIVLRGPNEMLVYSSDRTGQVTYPEIAKTGANTVRVMWMTDPSVSASDLDANIKNAVTNGLIPIIGLWDATGKWGADLEKCIAWWTSPAVVNVCKANPYMILNIANEAGGSSMPDYVSVYSSAVQRLRTAGITNVVQIDADYWGRNWNQISNSGAAIVNADPMKNVMFSWHTWDVNMDYATPINTIVAKNLCLVIGEFSYKSVGCACCINYTQIMATCQAQEVGYLPWSWGIVKNGDCPDGSMDMTTDGKFATLKPGWPTEICLTDPNSIKNTSKRPFSITHAGSCNVGNVAVAGVSVSPSAATLVASQNLTITPTILPANATNNSVTYTSSNPAIATVTNNSNIGTVFGLAAGTAIITTRTEDGGFTATSTITVKGGFPVPGKIEAENYSSMFGVQTEGASDVGGTLNVGFIETGDYMNYPLEVSSAGTYTLNLRVSNNGTGAGGFQIRSGSTVLANVSIPVTGGWQTWQTVSSSLTLPAGVQTIQIYCSATGFNINWFELTGGGTTSFTLTTSGTNGTVVKSPNQTTYTSGSIVSLTATPNSGYSFTGWAGDATGTANPLSVTMSANKNITANFSLTNTNVAVTGVTLAPGTASVAVGSTVALTATVSPANATDKTVSYSSSNTAVATVNAAGVVSGVSAGTATITVTTQDGSKTATSAITVTAVTGSTNIATSGTGTTWNNIPSATSTSDATKASNTAINNSNTSVDVVYADATAAGNWQAAGIVWSTAQSGITSVKFYNGTCTSLANNGVYSAGIKIQQSADGTSWTDISGWTISPAYQYTAASSNVVYTFSGASLSNVRGIRVIGQVRTNDSWSVNVKEVEVFSGSGTSNVAVTGVSVSPTSASVAVGGTTTLTATVAPSNATNKNVTWSSSNTAVATVSSAGVVTGVAAGSATITVTTQDGARTATSTITVTAANVAVTGVSVSPTSASVAVGATTTLTATVSPSNATNKNVSWSSSNTAVATVSSTGLVTGVAAGSTTITVTTQDGSKTATSAITVTGGSTGTSGTINFTSSAVGNLANPYNDASGYTLSGATSGGVAEPLVVLSNAGNNVARNTNFQSRITLTKTGGGSFNLTSLKYASDPWGGLADATITGTLAAGGTITASISSASTTLQTATLNWTGVTSVVIDFAAGSTSNYGMLDDIVVSSTAARGLNAVRATALDQKIQVVIFPNPVKDIVYLKLIALKASPVSISVFKANGQQVLLSNTTVTAGINNLQLNVAKLPSGIYQVSVKDKVDTITRKIYIRN
jgi:uncharacterized repeat protein (TIGR02543 family)